MGWRTGLRALRIGVKNNLSAATSEHEIHAQALSVMKDILTGLRASSDAFPPLKSAVGGVLYICELVEEVRTNKSQAAGLATRAAELILLLADLIDDPEDMPLDMRLALERFNMTLTDISEFMKRLGRQGVSRYLDRNKNKDQISHYTLRLNEAEKDFQLSSLVRVEKRLHGLGGEITEHFRVQDGVGMDIKMQLTSVDRKVQALSIVVVFLA